MQTNCRNYTWNMSLHNKLYNAECLCVFVAGYVCICMYECVCVCVCVRACVRTCMHACMHICMYVCV